MTTAWAYLVRGQLTEAAAVSASGLVLGLIAMVSGPCLIVSAVRARWWPVRPRDKAMAGILLAVATLMIVEWLMRVGTR